MASVARELQAELEGGDEVAAVAARDRWGRIKCTPGVEGECRIREAVTNLAGYQIYLRDASEKTISRVLGRGGRRGGRTPGNFQRDDTVILALQSIRFTCHVLDG